MSKKNNRYSEEEVLAILRDYFSGGLTKSVCARKYSLKCVNVLNYWLKKYESNPVLVSLQSDLSDSDMANRGKDSFKEENILLKKRIKELEKALAFSRLETEARDLMINKAESYFNISIRKKSGAK